MKAAVIALVAACALATALIVAALPMASPALAQAHQCHAPRGNITLPRITPDGERRDAAITGYTLALSWSPEFCRNRENDPNHEWQCSGEGGRFALLVHGLWPEGRGNAWPQWCPTRREPSDTAVRQTLCTMPSERMIAHEWAKHGACMVDNPDTYLRVTRILWNSLRLPEYDRLSRQRDLTAGDIRRAFADANRHWEVEHVGLAVNERGWLTELRLCYGADFMPAECGRRRFGPADDAPVRIWRGM